MSLHKRFVRYPGSATAVSCSDERDLVWLREFLGPSFWFRQSGSAEWSVECVRDASLRVELSSGAARRGPSRTVFHLDTRAERLPLLHESGPAITLWDPVAEAVCEVHRSERRVRLVAGPEGDSVRFTLMRFVRERAMRAALEDGALLLHGAGFVLNGRAVLLTGPKRSGKSSLLLHALETGGSAVGASGLRTKVRYLANDRLLVQPDRSRPEVRGLPTIVSLRAKGPGLSDETRIRIDASGFFPALTIREAVGRPVGRVRPWRGTTYTLSPAQLCSLVGVRAAATAPVGAILFPRISGVAGRVRVERLDPEAATSAMGGATFRAGHRFQVGRLFASSAGATVPGAKERGRLAQALAHSVPCYRCTLGLNAFRDPDWLRRLQDRLA